MWGTLLVFIMLVFFRYVEGWMPVENYGELTIRMNLENYETIKGRYAEIIRDNDILIQETRYRVDRVNNEVQMDFVLTYSKGKDREGMLMDLSGLEGVREVSG